VKQKNGSLCLELSGDELILRITEPKPLAGSSTWEDGNWNAKAVASGKFEIKERCTEQEICPTTGELDFTITDGRK